jgi:hypothetical protein
VLVPILTGTHKFSGNRSGRHCTWFSCSVIDTGLALDRESGTPLFLG